MDRRNFIRASASLPLAAVTTTQPSLAAQTPTDEAVRRLHENLNPKIQHARDVALDILKPTPGELERGLRVHAESVVFDSYGFSPRAAIDGDALAAQISAGASAIEIKDLREDMGMTRYVHDPTEQREYMDAWRASGVTCIFQNAGEEGQDALRLLKRLARFTFATDILHDFVAKAAVPDDVVAAKEAGHHCLYLTGNGVPLTQDNGFLVPDELRYRADLSISSASA